MECALKHLGSAKKLYEEATSFTDIKLIRDHVRECFFELNQAEKHLLEAPDESVRGLAKRIRSVRKQIEPQIYAKDPKLEPQALTEIANLIDELNGLAVEKLFTEDKEIREMVEEEAEEMGLKDKVKRVFGRPKRQYVLKIKVDDEWEDIAYLDKKIGIRQAKAEYPEVEEAPMARLDLVEGDSIIRNIWLKKPSAEQLSRMGMQQEFITQFASQIASAYAEAFRGLAQSVQNMNLEQIKAQVNAMKEIKQAFTEASTGGSGSSKMSLEDLLTIFIISQLGLGQSKVQGQSAAQVMLTTPANAAAMQHIEKIKAVLREKGMI